MKNNLLTAALSAIFLSGCSVVGDSQSVRTEGRRGEMNMQEAAMRADAILDRTMADIKPSVEWVHGQSTEGSCDVSRRRAVVTVISKERRGSFLGVVERGWKSAGYRQIGVNANAVSPAMYFETPDGFRVRLLIGGRGQAFFEVATPCVEESPVSEPEPRTVGAGSDGLVPAPNIHSDFWSANTPPPAPNDRIGPVKGD